MVILEDLDQQKNASNNSIKKRVRNSTYVNTKTKAMRNKAENPVSVSDVVIMITVLQNFHTRNTTNKNATIRKIFHTNMRK